MTYFAKDEMRITLGSLLNIFMSLAIKGRLFIAEFDTKISKNGVLLRSFCLWSAWKESWWKLQFASRIGFFRLRYHDDMNFGGRRHYHSIAVPLFSSPSPGSLNSYADDVLHVFLLWTETMMMKRAWRDLGSNLEKFSYLHSDLSSNDVLLVIFFDGSHPQNTVSHIIFYIFGFFAASLTPLENDLQCFAPNVLYQNECGLHHL